MASDSDWVTLDAERVSETDRAVQLQTWTGCGCDPRGSTKTQWFPKSVTRFDGRYWHAKRWFVGKNRLWHFSH